MASATQTARLFWHHASRYPRYIAVLAVFVPLSVFVGQFIPPLIVADVLLRLNEGNYNPNDLWGSFGWSLVLYALLTFVGGVVLWRVTIIAIWNLEMRVLRDMAQRVFNQLMNESAHFHANRFGGSLVSQTNKLLGSYIRFADSTVFEITTMTVAFIFTVAILMPKAPLFVALLLLVSILFMFGAYKFSKPVQKATAIKADMENKQTGNLADSITNVMAVKSFAAEPFEMNRFAEATERTRAATKRQMLSEIWRDTFASSTTATIESLALVLAVIAVVVFKADVALVYLMVAYTTNISRRLWEFSSHVLRNYSRSFGDASEMVDILNTEPDLKDPARPEEPRINRGAITFDDMTYTHADANDALFNNLHLKVAPGEKIGLVGHSGSGKTTLTKLLLRYDDLDGGAIVIDGQNIANIKQADLRQHIAYVPQEPLLFHRTLRENVAYGKPDASEEDIKLAAQRAHAAEFIDKLPHGYETLVGERGIKLSGGQRQRIAIARAMLKDAPILVLDEATSALDSESERLIQAALWELMKGRTAIVIAHRLSTIQRMDRIVVLEDGQIVEQGSHTELLAKKGVYADLWKHQSGGFIEE
jgi:ATP-binding cassette, subfamily B, bacterial